MTGPMLQICGARPDSPKEGAALCAKKDLILKWILPNCVSVAGCCFGFYVMLELEICI